MGHLRSVRSALAPFHIRKIVTKRSDPALGQPIRNCGQERVSHARPSTMRYDITRSCPGRDLEQSRNTGLIVQADCDRLWPGCSGIACLADRLHLSMLWHQAADQVAGWSCEFAAEAGLCKPSFRIYGY